MMPCDPFTINLTSNANRDINVCLWWTIYNWKLSINCLVYCISVYFKCMKSWLLIASRKISKDIFMYADMIFGFLWLARDRHGRMKLSVRISIRARCTTICDNVCQWLATGRWSSPGSPVSSTNKTDSHNIIEILLKVALNHHQTNKNMASDQTMILCVVDW